MKESVKRETQWAAFYHTSRESWYPKPEETIPFCKVPLIKPLPIVDMSKANFLRYYAELGFGVWSSIATAEPGDDHGKAWHSP